MERTQPQTDVIATEHTHHENRNSRGWTLVASFFKALMWAIDGSIVFGLFLFPPYYFLERANVRPLYRWLIVANSAIIHQVVYEANERFQTLAYGRAIPNYNGNPSPYGLRWWYNFLILDFIAYELTSLPAVAGIQVIALYLYYDLPCVPLQLKLWVLLTLEFVTFFAWALLEDLVNVYLLRRDAKPEEMHQPNNGNLLQKWARSYSWAFLRVFNPFQPMFALSWLAIALKYSSTVAAYVASHAVFEAYTNETDGVRIGAMVLFVGIFFGGYVFFGIRVPHELKVIFLPDIE